jgi:uncharacterized BrkB/YihY/UPF0761 family membrane protein
LPPASGSDAGDLEPAEGVPGRLERARLRVAEAVVAATERLPVLGTVIEASERERAIGGGLLAGGLAYRLFFWLVPFGLAAAAIAQLTSQTGARSLEDAASQHGLGAAASAAARQAVAASHTSPWVLLAIGVFFSIWFGMGVIRALTIVHALAWHLPIRKVRRPHVAGAAFTVAAAAMSLIARGISSGLQAVGLGALALALALVVVYGFVGLVVTAAFPHPRTTPQALIPGGILIGVGATALHAFAHLYLAPKLGRSVDTYGMLGGATVILLWLFIIARLITVAAFLNSQLWYRDHPRA